MKSKRQKVMTVEIIIRYTKDEEKEAERINEAIPCTIGVKMECTTPPKKDFPLMSTMSGD